MTKNKIDQNNCQHVNTEQKPVSVTGYKMKKVCYCGKIINSNIFPATTVEGFIRRWVHKKLSDVRMFKNKKVYYTQRNLGNYFGRKDKLLYIGGGRNVGTGEEILALILPNGKMIANASKLERCGSYKKGVESPAQQVIQRMKVAMLPFNVFEEAELDILKAEIIDQGKAEKLIVPKLRWIEHLGAFKPMSLWVNVYNKKRKPDKSLITKNLGVNFEYIWKGKVKTNRTKKRYSYQKFVKKNLEKRHFIGAMLLRIKEKNKKYKYFLFDCDRRELKYYNFNPFLTQLSKPVNTIAEAYDLLKPKEVVEAEKKKLKVLRQGEWFFIPTRLPKQKKLSKSFKILDLPKAKEFDCGGYHDWRRDTNGMLITNEEMKNRFDEINLKEKYQKEHKKRVNDFNLTVKKYLDNQKVIKSSDYEKYAISGVLQAGKNRPNDAEKYLELPSGVYVKGKITHRGREHEDLVLKEWYRPIPNTAIESFTITGAID